MRKNSQIYLAMRISLQHGVGHNTYPHITFVYMYRSKQLTIPDFVGGYGLYFTGVVRTYVYKVIIEKSRGGRFLWNRAGFGPVWQLLRPFFYVFMGKKKFKKHCRWRKHFWHRMKFKKYFFFFLKSLKRIYVKKHFQLYLAPLETPHRGTSL